MNIGIYYFSGTGNTRHVAGLMRDEFRAAEHDCEIIPMEKYTQKTKDLSFGDYDLVGIGFPVHAFDAPWLVYDFIELLPRQRTAYFLFKTAGDPFLLGGSTHRLRREIAGKGWIIRHESLFVMPPNLGGNASEERINDMLLQAGIHTREVVVEILSGKKVLLKDSGIQRCFSLINRGETLGTRMGSKNWVVSASCTLCGKCMRNCPTKNIAISGNKVLFKSNCVFCMKCRGYCPVSAISHKHLMWAMPKKPYHLD